jgi:hypothetical protein
MRIENFHPPKCRGMLQKIGVLYTHSPKRPSPFPKLPPKNKIIKKKEGTGSDRGRTGPWPAAGPTLVRPCALFFFYKFLLPSTFCASGQLLLVGSSTCPPCPEFA